MRGLILLLLSCRQPDPGEQPKAHAHPEVPDWTSYEGTFTWSVSGAGASEPGCALVFDFQGVPADVTCPDCEYSFYIEMSYDEESSVNTWRCIDEDEADFTWTLGFDADFYGYDIGAMWKYVEIGSYWFQAFYAEWDGGDRLVFGYDYTYGSYYYDYYLYSFYGTGTVSE